MLDHYLEVLVRKPGALPGATALAQARAAGAFTALHQRFWDAARPRHGDGAGTRALIGVLLLHRTLPAAAVLAGIDAALALGRCDADLVAVEARRHLEAAAGDDRVARSPRSSARCGAAAGRRVRPAPSAARLRRAARDGAGPA